MTKVIALQYHVVELKEGHGLFAVKPQLHRIEGEHTINREMRSDLLQQFDIAELSKPIMIVDHHRVRWTITKCQETFESGADGSDVRLDCLIGEHLAHLVLARGVTDPRCSTAHDDHWLMPCLLQSAQQHDRHEIADMKRWRGRVEADIGWHNLFRCQCVKRRGIRCLVNVATCIKQAEEIGSISSHNASAPSMEFRHWPIFR